MPFDLEKFLGAPREHLNTLQEAKKDQLRQIAVRARISVGHAVVKAELLGKILDFLINSGNITEEEALPLRPLTLERGAARTVTVTEDPEIVKLKLQLELQQLTLEAEQKRLEAANAALETEQRRLEIERKEKVLLEKELSAIRIEERLAEKQLPDAFDLSKARKLLPVFDEKDPDVFFITFENTATSLNWPRDQYVLLIRNSFKGKAAYVAAQLVQERDYEIFKTAILDAYSVTAEGYRQVFRQTLKNQAQTYLEFFTLKLKQFNKWIDKEQITTLEQLKNLIVLEEFLRRIPANVAMFIREKQEKDGKRAALLADDYHLIHKLKPHSSSRSSSPQVCTFCKKEGHHIKDCPSPKCKASHGKASPNAFSQGPKSGNTANKTTLHCAQPLSDFTAFTYPGKVNDIPVKILRDTGSSQTIISSKLKDLAKPTDQYVTVSDLTCQKVLPIVQISLDCPYFKGSTNVALLDSDLPCKNIDMILGNDLAQSNGTPSLIITQPEVVIEKACKELFPVVELPCQVVTRSTTSTSSDTEHTGKVDQSTLGEKVLADLVDIPSDEFVEYQRSDDSLKEYFDKVKDDVDESKLPYFYLDNNILMRRYRPLKIAGQNSWHDSYQLVVPSNLRAALLDLAHSAESHLGISKTYKRLLDDYYWPGMKADVKHHIESCHPCQVTGKPNQKIPPAPLVPITVPNSPFEKVIVDCVGPLPKTKKQNEYILTLLCPTTRFPLAVPIKNISARTIIVNLLKIFTIFGFPKELQCDQGTNFTSDLFKQTLKQLNISHIFASAYHPQTNGALERVHQTIKNLLRKYICETGRDWDEDLDLLMYVLRSTPNESTGISPFEMMFGRRPRTNLSMVKENILRGTYKDQQYLGHLPKVEREELEAVLKSYPAICSDTPGCCTLVQHDIVLEPNANPVRQPFYRVSHRLLPALKAEVEYLLKLDLAAPSKSPWASPCILVKKPNNSYRMCTDYRRVNSVTVKDAYPLPRIADIIDSVSNSKYLTQIDLLKGYYQIKLTDRTREISAFITPFGLFEYRVLPFGMTNAPATFQRMVHEVTRGLEGVYVYLDDIVIASISWDEHLKILRELFKRLLEANLVINLAKSLFGKAKVTYLGHVIGSGSILPKDTNVKAITSFPTPSDKKELKTFLGMVSYYSKFCPNFSIITSPLHVLTSSKVRFHWTQDHDKAFRQLKLFMTSSPLLQAPNLTKPFFIQVDACNTGFGGVLLQEINGTSTFPPLLEHLLPVSYYSGAFKGAQLGWPTIEKELYSLVATVLHFRPYLEGAARVVIYRPQTPYLPRKGKA
ncbi:uncharacterized protein [Palaemon carinicauda]|uniref:uncharacterized protein isoform X1 n=1 Tax=Palaemon carinicauda TaxID=392227 RepID=UPI0035B60CBF